MLYLEPTDLLHNLSRSSSVSAQIVETRETPDDAVEILGNLGVGHVRKPTSVRGLIDANIQGFLELPSGSFHSNSADKGCGVSAQNFDPIGTQPVLDLIVLRYRSFKSLELLVRQVISERW